MDHRDNRKADWINKMEKHFQGLNEGPKAKMYPDSLGATLNKYEIGERQAMIAYMDSGLKIHVHP